MDLEVKVEKKTEDDVKFLILGWALVRPTCSNVKFVLITFLSVIGASAARVASFGKWIHGTNPTVDTLDFTILSHVELSLGIICACLPSVAPLVRSAFNSKHMPSIFTSTQNAADSSHPGHDGHPKGWSSHGNGGMPPSRRYYVQGKSDDATILLERLETESSENVGSAAKTDEKLSEETLVACSTKVMGDDMPPGRTAPQRGGLYVHNESCVSTDGGQHGYVQAPKSVYIP